MPVSVALASVGVKQYPGADEHDPVVALPIKSELFKQPLEVYQEEENR